MSVLESNEAQEESKAAAAHKAAEELAASTGAPAPLMRTPSNPPVKLRANKRTQSFNSVSDFQNQQIMPEISKMQSMLPKDSGVQIEAKIGEGTFARVVVALNKRNTGTWKDPIIFRKLVSIPKEGEKLVLKVVKKKEGSEVGDLGEFENEVLLHTVCVHANIPRMYGYYDDGANLTIIMRFIADSTELRDLMNMHHILPEARLKLIMVQALRALAYLHAKGIAHRDISPRNILECSSGQAFLIDLGLAIDVSKPLGPCVPQGPQVGTLGYMSPESQLPEQCKWYRESDVWGLGCILYECLFGISPFLPYELHDPHKHLQFPGKEWGMDSSPEVQGLLSKMLEKEPQNRISASDTLELAFFSAEVKATADKVSGVHDRGGLTTLRREEEEVIDWNHDKVGSGEEVTRACLAVDLLRPHYLEPKVGEHVNFTATVFMQKNTHSAPPTPLELPSASPGFPSPFPSPAPRPPTSPHPPPSPLAASPASPSSPLRAFTDESIAPVLQRLESQPESEMDTVLHGSEGEE